MAKAKKEKPKTTTIKKDLDYFGLLKNAFGMVRHNRYLWYLGILSGGSFTSYNFGSGNFDGILNQKDNNASAASPVTSSSDIDTSKIWGDIASWTQVNWVLIAVIVTVVILLVIIFTVLSVMAKAGLVSSVDKLSKNEKNSFLDAMRFGWHKFWRVFGVSILIGLICLGIFTVLALPAVLLWFVKPLFVLYIILAILAGIFLMIVVGIISEYTLRYIVLKDGGVVSSIKSGFGLLRSKKKETALIWLITLGVGIIMGIILVMGILLVGIILFLIGLLLYLLMPIVSIIYAVIAVISFFIVLLVAGGFISSLISAYWTLCFKELETVK